MTAQVCAAAALAGLMALLVPAGPSVAGLRRSRTARTPYLCVAGGLALLVAVGSPQVIAVAAVVGLAAAVAVRLVGRQRVAAAATANRGHVVEMCTTVAAELAAGGTAPAALDRAGADWDLLAPAVRTAATGGDVPAALRDLSVRPGAGDLRVVAASWHVAHRTGQGLSDAVARVADEIREAARTERVVAGELASARATARLVAVLPVFALLLGSGAGGDPWSFLLRSPIGIGCLALGLGFLLLGLWWIEDLARGVGQGR